VFQLTQINLKYKIFLSYFVTRIVLIRSSHELKFDVCNLLTSN